MTIFTLTRMQVSTLACLDPRKLQSEMHQTTAFIPSPRNHPSQRNQTRKLQKTLMHQSSRHSRQLLQTKESRTTSYPKHLWCQTRILTVQFVCANVQEPMRWSNYWESHGRIAMNENKSYAMSKAGVLMADQTTPNLQLSWWKNRTKALWKMIRIIRRANWRPGRRFPQFETERRLKTSRS